VVARTDPLTRLPNRGQLDQGLPELIAQAREEQQPLCLLFLDIDHFKAINDRHGHAVGDRCLIAVGRILRRHVRASDLMARYGGEEFVVALEGAAPERAMEAAEALRVAVEAEGRAVDGHEIGMTISLGVSDLREEDSPATLLSRADAALYRAKREGRNRVVSDFS
jgi:diguanylate cyclase (GGDEF)-like protein